MSRQKRQLSQSGLYHIIFRGISRQNIFEETADYVKLKEITKLFMDDLLSFDEYHEMKKSIENDCIKLQKELNLIEEKNKYKKVKLDKSLITKSIKEAVNIAVRTYRPYKKIRQLHRP